MMNTSLEEEEDRTLRETLKYTLDESLQLEDDCLQAALTLSLNEFQTASTSRNISVRGNVNRDNPSDNHPGPSPETEMSEQEMLEAA
ncbi:hypothetical protein X975_22208, partial [Stegodyphus mimosarum]